MRADAALQAQGIARALNRYVLPEAEPSQDIRECETVLGRASAGGNGRAAHRLELSRRFPPGMGEDRLVDEIQGERRRALALRYADAKVVRRRVTRVPWYGAHLVDDLKVGQLRMHEQVARDARAYDPTPVT